MPKKLRYIVALVVGLTNFFIIAYFIVVVAQKELWNPQYIITIGGMILGNSMTANSLCLKTFYELIQDQHQRINALLCVGSSPKQILFPFLQKSVDTAILPTINSMISIGIVHLPGMMTGSILSGSVPFVAILYQIAIMIAICVANLLSSFAVLYLGQATFIEKENQTIHIN